MATVRPHAATGLIDIRHNVNNVAITAAVSRFRFTTPPTILDHATHWH